MDIAENTAARVLQQQHIYSRSEQQQIQIQVQRNSSRKLFKKILCIYHHKKKEVNEIQLSL